MRSFITPVHYLSLDTSEQSIILQSLNRFANLQIEKRNENFFLHKNWWNEFLWLFCLAVVCGSIKVTHSFNLTSFLVLFFLILYCSVTLGVSICLDVVSIETLDLDTKKKSVSTVEKILILSRHHHPDPNISIEIKIYRDLSRFTKNLNNFSISIEK